MRFTFEDILKSNFIENYQAITVFDMITTIGLAFVLGSFIFIIYKKTFSGLMYSKSFGITLVALTMITSMLILAVTSNIVLSLGMVGALSIVRFRTAIKEPSDIAFLFWSIAVGIILSAGFFPLALVGSLCIGAMLVVFSRMDSHSNPYILMLNLTSLDGEQKIKEILENKVKAYSLKGKTIEKSILEINYEIRLKDENTDFLEAIYKLEEVDNCILVSYNGEYLS